MTPRTRREFLSDVGRGMLVAGIGYSTAFDLGLTPAFAEEGSDALQFGSLEPFVRLMQDTPAVKLQPVLIEKLKNGTEIRELVAAAALANARTFGGQDYIGFHTMMAFAPAWYMTRELPSDKRALPVLKVLYRNSSRIQDHGGHDSEILHVVKGEAAPGAPANGDALREAVIKKDMEGAERTFATIAHRSADDAFNEVLLAVQDMQEVHRVVLPYRAWDLLPVVGREHAHTLLRQSLRYCVHNENAQYRDRGKESRELLPKLLDQYKLIGKPMGTRAAEDAWIEKMSQTIFSSTPAQSAEAVAAALAEGMSLDSIGEAISVAANQLVLRDVGRLKSENKEKPVGSIHGDSIGVHACDSANAWRNMSKVTNPRNAVASLILGAYQVARDRGDRGGTFLTWQPYPLVEHREMVKAATPAAALAEAEAAIRENNQALACAAIGKYGELDGAPRPAFDLLLRYALSEDGALHAEKYYRTCSEEFAITRPAFRWRQLLALTRVTASEYGKPAPGYDEAVRLLQG